MAPLMRNTIEAVPKRGREIHYYRQRLKNRVFSKLSAFFVEQAEARGITKKDLAVILGKDQAQITRWLSSPANLTLETISDLLLALDAELDPVISRFEEKPKRNYSHPVYVHISSEERRPYIISPMVISGSFHFPAHGSSGKETAHG